VKWTSRQRRSTSRRTEAGQHSDRNTTAEDKHNFFNIVLSRIRRLNRSSYRQPRFCVAAVTAAAFLIGVTAFVNHQMNQTRAWQQVFTNGQFVGLVPNQGSILRRMQRMANGYGVSVRFAPVRTKVDPDYDWQSVTELPVASYAITLNGEPQVYTASRFGAQQTLSSVEKSLLPANLAKSADVHFNGHVGIIRTITGVANILPTHDAVSYLLNPATPTLSSRAESALAAHQSMLHRGALQVHAQSPNQQGNLDARLQLMVHETVTQTVSTPYPVKYLKTNRLGKGETKVVKAGHSGRQKEQVSLTYTNGVLSSRDVTGKTVLEQPVMQVENLGTNTGLASGSWITPVSSYVVTSPFGPRHIFGHYEFHPGIDLACPQGTPVHATNNGTVESAGWNSGGYGNWVVINNGNGIETVFGHNSRVLVHAGEEISKGQLIAYSGETGEATGPHVHYEVRKNGTAINPVPYM
jgi:hypothetical protein